MSKQPITLDYRLAHPILGPEQQLTQMLLCSMTAKDVPLAERPPLTLMLCVDTSGSMMGRPLELVIESIRMLLDQLNKNDRLGMVIFSNRPRIISSVRSVNEEGKSFFQGVLSGIQAMGSTHLEGGLRLALEHMPSIQDGELGHIVLFSDGKPNRGEISTTALANMVGKHQDITLSSFGFGLKHDEDLLQKLARTGKGGYAYIESPDMVPLAFAKELGSLFSVVGTSVKLLLRPLSGCSIVGLRSPQQQILYTERGMAIELPDLIAGQTFHLLMKIQLQTQSPPARHRFCEMELRYTLTGSTPQEISFVSPLFYEVKEDPEIELDPIVATRVLLQDVSEAWEKAHQHAMKKHYDEAVAMLAPLLPRLKMALNMGVNSEEIRNWYEQIVDEVAILSQRPDEERYQRVRKAAKSEMSDPTGIFRRSNTSIINLNTTQRNLLGELMLKAVGMPHAHLRVITKPSDSDIEEGHTFPILGEVSIGRLGQIQLDHPSVSKRHVRLVATPKGYLLIDLLSTNAPIVNDKPVSGPTRLEDGDKLCIGDFVLSFHMGLAPELKPKNR